jgi:hypothetical protein
MGGEPWCQEIREAVDKTCQAVDRQQDADGTGHEPRLEHQVRQTEDVKAEERGVHVVAAIRQSAGQGCQRLELCWWQGADKGPAAQKGQRCELVDEASGLDCGRDEDENAVSRASLRFTTLNSS